MAVPRGRWSMAGTVPVVPREISLESFPSGLAGHGPNLGRRSVMEPIAHAAQDLDAFAWFAYHSLQRGFAPPSRYADAASAAPARASENGAAGILFARASCHLARQEHRAPEVLGDLRGWARTADELRIVRRTPPDLDRVWPRSGGSRNRADGSRARRTASADDPATSPSREQLDTWGAPTGDLLARGRLLAFIGCRRVTRRGLVREARMP